MEDSLLCPLLLCAFPTLACLLVQRLFPAFIMQDDLVIRTSVRKIVLYRELPGGRRVLTRVLGWRYSIQILHPSPYMRRKKALRKHQHLVRGNQRRPLLSRLLKWMRQRRQRTQDEIRLPPSSQDHSSPSARPARQPCPPAS
jgi:hypothetical protein